MVEIIPSPDGDFTVYDRLIKRPDSLAIKILSSLKKKFPGDESFEPPFYLNGSIFYSIILKGRKDDESYSINIEYLDKDKSNSVCLWGTLSNACEIIECFKESRLDYSGHYLGVLDGKECGFLFKNNTVKTIESKHVKEFQRNIRKL